MTEPWHGYTECPVCGCTDIVESVDEDLLIVSCGGCGQTLHDEWIGSDD